MSDAEPNALGEEQMRAFWRQWNRMMSAPESQASIV
jgi:hypothetical protein